MRLQAKTRERPHLTRCVGVGERQKLEVSPSARAHAGKGREDLRLALQAMRDVTVEMRARVRDGVTMRWQGETCGKCPQSMELLEVDPHVTVAENDDDRAFARHHIAHEERRRVRLP